MTNSYLKTYGSWINNNINSAFLLLFFLHVINIFYIDFTSSKLVAFLASLSGMVAYIILALVTLIKDRNEALIALFASIVPSIIFYVLDGGFIFWFMPILISSLIFVLATNLKQQSSFHMGFELSAIIISALIIVAHLVFPDIDKWWLQQFKSQFHQLSVNLSAQENADLQKFYDVFPKLQTGYTAALWGIVSPLFSVYIAKLWLEKFAPIKNYISGLYLGKYVSIVAVFVLLAGIWIDSLLLTSLSVFWLLMFLLVAISMFHYLAAHSNKKAFILFLFYASMIFVPFILPIFMVLGCLDCLIKIRQPLKEKFFN